MVRCIPYTLASVFTTLMTTTSPVAFAQNAVKPTAIDEIVVTASRTREQARSVQKIAPNLVNIQSAEEIAKYPDFNAAEALGRVPGLSLSSDTGEGRFINLRGLDANLNGATFDGVVLLNTFPGGTAASGSGRAVEFDTIPTGMIDQIIVTKTGLPSHEAEGLGGSIELTPRTAQAMKGNYLVEGTLGGSYQNLRKSYGARAEGTVGYKFGLGGDGTGFFSEKHPLRILLTGAYNEDRRGIDDAEPGYRFDDPDRTIDAVDLRYYKYNRRRFAYGADVEYKPNDDHAYFFRYGVAGYRESVYRQILAIQFGDFNGHTQNNLITATSDNSGLTKSNRNEVETHRNTIYTFGGKDKFESFSVDYRGSFSKAAYNKPYDYFSAFTNPNAVSVSYNSTNPNAIIYTQNTAGVLDSSQYSLTTFANSTEFDNDKEWSGAFNVTIPVYDGDGKFKFGGEVRLRDKSIALASFKYDGNAVAALNLPLTQFQYNAPVTFYNGTYQIGNPINGFDVDKFVSGALTPTLSVNNGVRGSFNDSENIYAGYAQYDIKFDDLSFLIGARIENTRATYRGTGIDPATGILGPSTINRSYTNIFPTVQARYAFQPALIGRATYSTGIARPGFFQITPNQSISLANIVPKVTTGNPNLKPTTGNNFDVSLEYYLPEHGIFSLGLFGKEFNNYVLPVTRLGVPFAFAGFNGLPSGTLANLVTFANAQSANVYGMEAAYDQRMAFLPAPFDGIGVNANFTYAKSKGQLAGATTSSELPGTSKFTYNTSLYYEAHGVQARLSATHVSSSFFDFGATIQSARTQIDWTSSYDIIKDFAVYFNAKNLNNSPLRYSQLIDARVTQREFYLQTFEAGVRFKFQ